MYHLYSPQKWPMEIGNHKWPLKSHCNPDERSEEGYNWCFWGHEWLPIPLVTIEDYTNTIVFISNHLWRTKMFLKNGKNFQGKLVKWQNQNIKLGKFHEKTRQIERLRGVQMKLVGIERYWGPTNFICTPQPKTYQFHLYPAAFRFDEFFHGIFKNQRKFVTRKVSKIPKG